MCRIADRKKSNEEDRRVPLIEGNIVSRKDARMTKVWMT